ncbi:hypothetical protein VTO42DRAFT_5017 [Malbranchea cinnamomea]
MRWLRCTVLCMVTSVITGGGTVGATLLEEVVGKRQLRDEGSSGSTALIGSPRPAVTTTAVPPIATTEQTPRAEDRPDTVTRDDDEDENEDEDTETDPPPVCHAEDSPKKPFCLPEDGKSVYVDEKYLVTWDPDELPVNSTVVIGLTYVNDTDGKSPYVSSEMPNTLGFMSLVMEKDWLQGKSQNNLTLYIAEYDPQSGKRVRVMDGPTISLSKKPPEHQPPPPELKHNKLGVMIGVPLGIAAFLLILLGLFFGMRHRRRIGLGNVMGRRLEPGSQRTINRLGRRKRGRMWGGPGAAIRLENLENVEQYRDDPDADHDVDPFTSARPSRNPFNDIQRAEGNAFRQEVHRLKSWR